MNPAEQSGDDMCERPVLNWVEFRHLVGVGALILLVCAVSSINPPTKTQESSAAAVLTTEERAFVETHQEERASTTPFTGLPEPR